MSSNTNMERLSEALQQLPESSKPVRFWLRDDDAVEPGEALDRLLALAEAHAIPLSLAVIPAMATAELRLRLESARQVSVAVHGWSHHNHAPANEKKQELGSHRSSSEVLAELRRGFKQLSGDYGEQFLPVLVPPWNRISSELVPALGDIGFQALSTFAEQEYSSIPMINTQVDIIDWKKTRGGRATGELVSEIIAQLRYPQNPIGLLTHHLVHDEQAWQFLEQLFVATSHDPAVRWIAASELLESSP
ncbi:polysaccharide deacetylase family protein [Granulosicoccus antarcticus]|uniref:NodB homology domain-containing protein n=1 Tax=Granulosicoccus antarcticus IMCC3135 TaxID=1192854 RepID=A0A2Z2NX05_9GAMM|nr:polysaccharide deacetylase family protein [Granulosicoccus antarcticus]ASJ75962.1 hypothetical protein IMCC3135_29560 [Granulosicoccus antarcticus IMCC3135]